MEKKKVLNINDEQIDRCKELGNEIQKYQDKIKQMEETINMYSKEIKEFAPRGYFYVYDKSRPLNAPIKCGVSDVCCIYGQIHFILKEVRKNSEKYFSLNEFLKLKFYRNGQDAMNDYKEFMVNRQKKIDEFKKNDTLFYGEDGYIYEMKYDDEYVRERGYFGKKFTFQRLDTNEIIETSNLWSSNTSWYKNYETFPKIRFIGENPH